MQRRTSRRCLLAATLVLIAVAAVPASAQSFPSKPIRVVHQFPGGSGAEMITRPFTEHISATLGQNVLLDPRPGGNGAVAMQFAKTQPPDGYTLYYGSASSIERSLAPNSPVDLRKDFVPVAPAVMTGLILAVNTDLVKATTVKELIDEARANPGKLNYAYFSTGSQIPLALLALDGKVNMVPVRYQGTAQATLDTAAGRVHMHATVLGVLRPHVASLGGSGKLRMLAVMLADRWEVVPDLPGMREAGFPSVDAPAWSGYFAPAGIPRNIVDTLNRAINAAYKDPKFKEHTARFGVSALSGTPEDLAQTVTREFATYTRLTNEIGLKLE